MANTRRQCLIKLFVGLSGEVPQLDQVDLYIPHLKSCCVVSLSYTNSRISVCRHKRRQLFVRRLDMADIRHKKLSRCSMIAFAALALFVGYHSAFGQMPTPSPCGVPAFPSPKRADRPIDTEPNDRAAADIIQSGLLRQPRIKWPRDVSLHAGAMNLQPSYGRRYRRPEIEPHGDADGKPRDRTASRLQCSQISEKRRRHSGSSNRDRILGPGWQHAHRT